MANEFPQSLTLEQAFNQAIARHRAEDMQEAERLYRAILQTHPNHPDANHNLGVLALQVKQPAESLSHFKAALEANPNQGQYWLSYIDALIQAGQLDVALQILKQGRQRGLQGEAVEALASGLDGLSGGELIAQCKKMPKTSFRARQDAEATAVAPTQDVCQQLVALFNAGQHVELEKQACLLIEKYPDFGFAWKVLGASFQVQGKDALPALQKATKLLPDDAEAHSNLGAALRGLGQLDEAVASCRRALEIKPDYAEALSNLGTALTELGRPDEAVASCRRALEIKPDYADALSNLGAALRVLGQLDEAVASCRRALEIKPNFAIAHYNLGNALRDLGQLDAAVASYRRTLEIKPDYVEAHYNLALLLNAQGKFIDALGIIKQSINIKETAEAKRIFVDCVKRLRLTRDDSDIRANLIRALTDPWGQPSELAEVCIGIVKLNPYIVECIARVTDVWPQRLPVQDLFGANELIALADNTLLISLLNSALVCDSEMECFLTMVRRAMLDKAIGSKVSDGQFDPALNFYCALARQCFVNEYIFSLADDEIQEAGKLRNSLIEALDAGTPIPVHWPVTVAAYFPLCSLSFAARLLDMQWPEAVEAMLVQQIREPEEERQLRTAIPRLTCIEDDVSLLVQSQYEANPYPRWIKLQPAGATKNFAVYLHQKFPLASFKRHGKTGNIDILIAGCGTGQHSIGVAQLFHGAKVLAVDLSLSSLGYAKRKTLELGLTSIEYAQADLLQLGALGRTFDVIESVGVLHHLADPWGGWRVLLSLLRPGGYMKLGFYSEVARRNIVRARSFIAEQGYGSSANEIRQCRQDLMVLDKSADFGTTLKSKDFYSMSTCRDLLFHVQEHRMTLTNIEAFLRASNLVFMGFEIDLNVVHAYRQRFPDDQAAINLGQWQIFENENPDIFLGMYQFWIQKQG